MPIPHLWYLQEYGNPIGDDPNLCIAWNLTNNFVRSHEKCPRCRRCPKLSETWDTMQSLCQAGGHTQKVLMSRKKPRPLSNASGASGASGGSTLRFWEFVTELTELMCFWTLSCGKSFGLSWLGLRPETELVAVVASYITWGECLSVVPHETEKITLAVDGEDCLASLFLCSLLMPRPSMTHCKTLDSFYRLSIVPQCLEHPKWSKCGVLQDSDSDSSGSSALSPWDPWVKLQVMSCWSESSASISLIEHDWKRSNDPEHLQLDRRWDLHELFLRKPLHESRLFFARLTLGQNAISKIFGQGACSRVWHG